MTWQYYSTVITQFHFSKTLIEHSTKTFFHTEFLISSIPLTTAWIIRNLRFKFRSFDASVRKGERHGDARDRDRFIYSGGQCLCSTLLYEGNINFNGAFLGGAPLAQLKIRRGADIFTKKSSSVAASRESRPGKAEILRSCHSIDKDVLTFRVGFTSLFYRPPRSRSFLDESEHSVQLILIRFRFWTHHFQTKVLDATGT